MFGAIVSSRPPVAPAWILPDSENTLKAVPSPFKSPCAIAVKSSPT